MQQRSATPNIPNSQKFLLATLPETLTFSDTQNYSKFILDERKEILMVGKFMNVSFRKTDHLVFDYKFGYANICDDQVEACIGKFDFFSLTVHYEENKSYYEGIFFSTW